MKDNKSQPASTLVNNEFAVVTPNIAKIVPLNNRYDGAKQAPHPAAEEKNTIIRRYSFDDNGGGYLGL